MSKSWNYSGKKRKTGKYGASLAHVQLAATSQR